MNLFLLWLLQHSIIAIFTCGLKDNLAHGVGNPARCRQRTEEWNRKGSDALLLHWTPGGHQNQFTRYRWKKPDAERFSLPCSRQCSRLRARSAHFVSHLPATPGNSAVNCCRVSWGCTSEKRERGHAPGCVGRGSTPSWCIRLSRS